MLPLRDLPPRLFPEFNVPLTNRLVDVDFPNPTSFDTLDDQIIWEVAESVQHQMLVRRTRFADFGQPIEFQELAWSTGRVGAVHVAKCRSQVVNSGVMDVVDGALRIGEKAFHVRSLDTVFSAVNPPHLGFYGDAH